MAKTVRLVKARQERFTCRRGWFVNEWRLVLASDPDIDAVQPYFDTKREAKEFAKEMEWEIVE